MLVRPHDGRIDDQVVEIGVFDEGREQAFPHPVLGPAAEPLVHTVPSALTREIWPFFLALLVALVLVTYIPSIAMWLPNVLMPPR
jgi:hypothetical protein